jgi:hypothetical protein
MKLRRKALGISIKKISLILKWSLLIDCYSQRFPKLRKAFEEAKATGGSGGNDHDNAVQAPPQKTPVKRKADGDGSAKPKSATMETVILRSRFSKARRMTRTSKSLYQRNDFSQLRFRSSI